jgi:hypothetical protein
MNNLSLRRVGRETRAARRHTAHPEGDGRRHDRVRAGSRYVACARPREPRQRDASAESGTRSRQTTRGISMSCFSDSVLKKTDNPTERAVTDSKQSLPGTRSADFLESNQSSGALRVTYAETRSSHFGPNVREMPKSNIINTIDARN